MLEFHIFKEITVHVKTFMHAVYPPPQKKKTTEDNEKLSIVGDRPK